MSENKIKVYEVVVRDEANDAIKRLVRKKKFASLPKQIFDLADEFEKGIFDGDVVLTYEEPAHIVVYKVRLPNPDANVGKSNGYRVIYAVAIERKLVAMLSVYYKKETATISDHEIRAMLNAFIADYIPEDTEVEA
jgi:mRNA-degrading endonuclease RelE of RelBE toxin-antitoxin system